MFYYSFIDPSISNDNQPPSTYILKDKRTKENNLIDKQAKFNSLKWEHLYKINPTVRVDDVNFQLSFPFCSLFYYDIVSYDIYNVASDLDREAYIDNHLMRNRKFEDCMDFYDETLEERPF